MDIKRIVLIAVTFAAIFLACVCTGHVHSEKAEVMPGVDAVEFEMVHNSLYDAAMTICTGLAECDGGCFYTDVDAELVEVFKTYRVPSMEVLLNILDQIDEHGSVYDVYDDDEGTAFEYYELRERYESFF